MILVTGSSGFIAQHFIEALESRGDVVLAVDVDDAFELLESEHLFKDIEMIIHQGAISDTRAENVEELYRHNVLYSMQLFDIAARFEIPVRYASSASVYGNAQEMGYAFEAPLNQYGLSKLILDRWVEDNMKYWKDIQGFRYYNVYGQGEDNKVLYGSASPISTFIDQANRDGVIKIFEGSEQFFRDFIYVKDVVDVVLYNTRPSGIYDLGTSRPRSFYEIAHMIAEALGAKVETIPFPDRLRGKYQTYTECGEKWKEFKFINVEDYVNAYSVLNRNI